MPCIQIDDDYLLGTKTVLPIQDQVEYGVFI